MKYQMLVLDIDGTLTNSEKKVTPNTRKALIGLQERGVRVVIASGRPTPNTRSCKFLSLDAVQYGIFYSKAVQM